MPNMAIFFRELVFPRFPASWRHRFTWLERASGSGSGADPRVAGDVAYPPAAAVAKGRAGNPFDGREGGRDIASLGQTTLTPTMSLDGRQTVSGGASGRSSVELVAIREEIVFNKESAKRESRG